MIVYHGSTIAIESPSIKFSRKFLDFGVGFYATEDKIQAERWAKRKNMRGTGKAIVNSYEFKNDLSDYKKLSFLEEDETWLEFIVKCRSGDTEYKKFDIIEGSVANDDVFKTIDLYMKGIWEKERTLKEIRYYQNSSQICIINQELIDNQLMFLDFNEVK